MSFNGIDSAYLALAQAQDADSDSETSFALATQYFSSLLLINQVFFYGGDYTNPATGQFLVYQGQITGYTDQTSTTAQNQLQILSAQESNAQTDIQSYQTLTNNQTEADAQNAASIAQVVSSDVSSVQSTLVSVLAH